MIELATAPPEIAGSLTDGLENPTKLAYVVYIDEHNGQEERQR